VANKQRWPVARVQMRTRRNRPPCHHPSNQTGSRMTYTETNKKPTQVGFLFFDRTQNLSFRTQLHRVRNLLFGNEEQKQISRAARNDSIFLFTQSACFPM
jgi:hypothetical protein